MCPGHQKVAKPKSKKPGYDCVMEGDVCESQRFCCMELICSKGKDGEKRCIDASEEVKKYGLGGLVTPSSIDDEGDVSYASKSPNQTDFLKKERDKLNIPPHALEVMEKADKKNKLVEASS